MFPSYVQSRLVSKRLVCTVRPCCVLSHTELRRNLDLADVSQLVLRPTDSSHPFPV